QAQRRGQGARQQGGLSRPLRAGPGDGGLSGGGLVHVRGPGGHRRDHRGAPRERPPGRATAHLMPAQASRGTIAGAAGAIELAWTIPAEARAVAVVAHPHPLFGGTMDNKVVTTLARAFTEAGAATYRFNFRGVGATEGTHDEGRGETDDMLRVIEHARGAHAGAPLWLAGFSFGGAVATRA